MKLLLIKIRENLSEFFNESNKIFQILSFLLMIILSLFVSYSHFYQNYKVLLYIILILTLILSVRDINYILIIFITYSIIVGNLEIGSILELGSVSILLRDIFILILFIIGLCFFIQIHFLQKRQRIVIHEILIILFLLYSLILFLQSILKYKNYESAGVELRSIVIYAITFSIIYFLKNQKRCLLLLKIIFISLIVYCIIFFSIYFWKGNPLNNLCPSKEYLIYDRITYVSKSLFVFFPFLISAFLLTPRQLSKKLVYSGLLLSVFPIILSLSRAVWIVLFLGVPIQVMFLIKKMSFSFILKKIIILYILMILFLILSLILLCLRLEYYNSLKERLGSICLIPSTNLGVDYIPELSSLHSRYISYQLILNEIKYSFFLGHGLGASIYHPESSNDKNAFVKFVDSSYLVYLFKGGFLWLFIFLIMLLSFIKKVYIKMKNSDSILKLFLSSAIFFSLVNTTILAVQDLILYTGLQITTISVLFALIIQWEVIFDEKRIYNRNSRCVKLPDF